MYEAIVGTLAVGSVYADLAASFLRHFVHAGNAALVVTDAPTAFTGMGIVTVPYPRDGTHIWHGKRHVLRASLELARTVYFVDGDHRLYTGWETRVSTLSALPVPCTFSPLRTLEGLRFLHHPEAMPTAPAATVWLDRTAEHMCVPDWRSLTWWGDWLYALARDTAGAWHTFLDAWDRFALWVRDDPPPHPLVGSDGVAMAFAARLAGWTPTQDMPVFAPIVRAFSHLFVTTCKRPVANS